MECFAVSGDQCLHDGIVDRLREAGLDQGTGGDFVRVTVPELFLVRSEVREGGRGDDILDAAQFGWEEVRVVYDTLDEVLADDGAVVVCLHLMRHLTIDEVESVEE